MSDPTQPTPSSAGDARVDEAAAFCLDRAVPTDLVRIGLAEVTALSSDRAAFAACLLTLELARRGDPEAVRDLPRHVPVLLRAHRDPGLAATLMGRSANLRKAWDSVREVVASFAAGTATSTASASEATEPREACAGEAVEELDGSELVIDEESELSADDLEEVHVDPDELRAAPQAQLPPSPGARKALSEAMSQLGILPGNGPMRPHALSCESRSGRERLLAVADGLRSSFPLVPEGLALASLLSVFAATKMPEAGLFGRDRKRAAALEAGLQLLGDPVAAGRAAVFFEVDGPETMAGFARVVDAITGYLGFCHSMGLDPQSAETARAFVQRS